MAQITHKIVVTREHFVVINEWGDLRVLPEGEILAFTESLAMAQSLENNEFYGLLTEIQEVAPCF